MKSKQDPRTQFGKRLRKLRHDAGLSQEALAYVAELDRSYVGGVERGEYNISLLNICALAHALGASPDELLKFTDEPIASLVKNTKNAKAKK